MTYDQSRPDRSLALNSLHAALLAFPVACFSLTVLTDAAYWQTENLLWLHFSEWLLLAGLVFGAAALLVRVAEALIRRVRPSWGAMLGGVVVLLLATVNSLIHTVDGWQAVVPYGLTASILTVLVMILTAWAGGRRMHHV